MSRLGSEGIASGQVEEAMEKVDRVLGEVDAFRAQVHAQAALQKIMEDVRQGTRPH